MAKVRGEGKTKRRAAPEGGAPRFAGFATRSFYGWRRFGARGKVAGSSNASLPGFEILSKFILLARDGEIKVPNVLDQIRSVR